MRGVEGAWRTVRYRVLSKINKSGPAARQIGEPKKAMESEIIAESGDVRIALAAASGVHERESLFGGDVGSYESPLDGGTRGR